MKAKAAVLFLCLIMLVTACVPGTLAASIDAQTFEPGYSDAGLSPETIISDDSSDYIDPVEEATTVQETTVPDETDPENEIEETTPSADDGEEKVSEEETTTVVIPEEDTTVTDDPEEAQVNEVPVSFCELSEEDQEIVMTMIYRKEGLSEVRLLAAPAAEQIDKSWFVILKDGVQAGSPAQNIPAGEITEESVPDFTDEGYSFAGAYYKGVRVLRTGQVEYKGRLYVYYVTEGSDNGFVALVLNDGDQIELRYKLNAVPIRYFVNGTEGQQGEAITVSGIPYGQTVQGVITVIPEDNPFEVFPGDDYSFTVNIPRGYQGRVSVNGIQIDPVMGVIPEYQMLVDASGNRVHHGTIIRADEDAEYLTSYTYTVQDPSGEQNVRIELTKETTHTFSADLISYTAYFGGTYNRNKGTHGDRATVNGWSGSISADGKYTWILTTTTNGGKWEMDALQMNETDLSIPFVNNKEEITILPSGTKVSIVRTYAKGWIFDDTSRYVYTITLSDCYEDVVVTGGNLRSRTWNEYIPYEFTGVSEFQFKNNSGSWVNARITEPIPANEADKQHTFRFKLMPGYGNPKLILKKSDEQQNTISSYSPTLGPDGYYTVNFSTKGLSYPVLVVIEAETIDNIKVEYLPGEVSAADTPSDDNTYSLAGKKDILIPLAYPADPEGNKVFAGWENGGKTYAPNTLVSLEEVNESGGKVTFTATWKDSGISEQITYYVQIVNEDGEILKTTASQAPADTALILDDNSALITEWLAENPEYEIDTDKTVFYYESIENGDVIKLEARERTAVITYTAVGPDGESAYGSVSPVSESLKVKKEAAAGSDAAAGAGFCFEGWFDNEECEGDPISTDIHFTPEKQGDMWEDAEYFARFGYAYADLMISKEGWETVDENQSFVFRVTGTDAVTSGTDVTVVIHGTGSVVIKDLPAGSYSITEDSSWSWRYSGSGAYNIALAAGKMTGVSFTNTRNKIEWLNGSTWCDNRWIDNRRY